MPSCRICAAVTTNLESRPAPRCESPRRSPNSPKPSDHLTGRAESLPADLATQQSLVGNPNHGRLYYRCTATRDFARQREISHPPALYLREDLIIRPVDEFLHDELTGRRLTDNLRRVAEAQHRAALAAYGDSGETEKLRQAIADADRKIIGYRATLDAGGDPALIAGWIAETTAIKKTAQARLGFTEAPPQRMTRDQLDAIAKAFNDLLGLLRDADPRDRAELYSRLGLRMTYRPGPETLMAEVVTPADLRVFDMCPEGDLTPHLQHPRNSRVFMHLFYLVTASEQSPDQP